MKHFPIVFNFMLVLSALYVAGSVYYFLSGLPYRGYVIISAICPLIFLIMRQIEARNFIDNKIRAVLGDLKNYNVYTKSLPGYRFVDVYNAAAAVCSEPPAWVRIESQHAENLALIITGQFYMEPNRRIKTPERVARPIKERTEGFFPIDTFWLRAPSGSRRSGIIRVRLQEYTHELLLEVAATEQADAEATIKQILDRSTSHSIFKNKMIEVSFDQEVKDNYGNIERNERVDPIFLEKPPVTDHDIILDDETRSIIQRTVIDFHERRKELMDVGLPGRRGVLFYGPPGTGKTYTCRYLSYRLESATTVISAGMSLLHIKSICNIARMLQPSIVILEDVDLVYSAREINAYTTALGELMDELDGFNPEDHIIFILTTNAIDRVEAAIKERPGRISQCVFFGAPTAELRRLYLKSMLTAFNCANLDMDDLVGRTEGVTQAFLKELVYRAVQVSTESNDVSIKPLPLTNEHFDVALDEMKRSAGRSGEAIIGFRVDR